jgi:hypothetical protein
MRFVIHVDPSEQEEICESAGTDVLTHPYRPSQFQSSTLCLGKEDRGYNRDGANMDFADHSKGSMLSIDRCGEVFMLIVHRYNSLPHRRTA